MGLVLGKEVYDVVGACFEVYNEKGCGFLEAVYQECLEIELALQEIPFVGQAELSMTYKGRPLRQAYRVDLVCCEQLIVELKAVRALNDQHRAQLLNYLHATGMPVGLLVNFGHYPKLEWERLVV